MLIPSSRIPITAIHYNWPVYKTLKGWGSLFVILDLKNAIYFKQLLCNHTEPLCGLFEIKTILYLYFGLFHILRYFREGGGSAKDNEK